MVNMLFFIYCEKDYILEFKKYDIVLLSLYPNLMIISFKVYKFELFIVLYIIILIYKKIIIIIHFLLTTK